MTHISSRQNPLIMAMSKLSIGKYREEAGLFAIEGVKLFEEMLKSGITPKYAFATEKEAHLLRQLSSECERFTVTDSVYQKISCEKSPQGIFCAIKYLDNFHNFATIYSGANSDSVICLSSLRDPGNLGTVIRTARAFGIGRVILSSDCADIYSHKTLRASMGALFAVPTQRTEDLAATLKDLAERGYTTCATTLNDSALSLEDMTVDRKTCFVIGNEGHGLSKDIINACQNSVYIRMTGGCESLNASVAATVLLWEIFKKPK